MDKLIVQRETNGWHLYLNAILLVICISFLSVVLWGCSKKEEEPAKSVKSERVSWDEIEIKYPSYKEQMEELKGYDEAIKNLESKDSLLKDMLQKASYNSVEEHLKSTSEADEASLDVNVKRLREHLQKIHSLGPDKSLGFVKEASQAKDIDLLCVCLSAVRTEMAQSEVARALGATENPEVVRSLVSRLSAVAAFMTGGTEGEIIRKETRAAFVKAISECTGLEFPDYDPGSEEDTLVVIKRTERWLKEHNL